MSEAQTDFLDSELLRDAEATNQRPALSAEAPPPDELKTTRMPSITPPPPLLNASVPPLAMSFPPPAPVPQLTSTADGTARYPAAAAGGSGNKPSWLQALLTTTFPPPSAARHHATSGAPISAQTAGAVFAGMGLIFALVALVTGLRGAPSDAALAPVVAAALVIARALIAVGSGALSFAMFRQAERLLVHDPAARD